MRLIQRQKEKARAPMQRLLSYHVILFLLRLTLSTPAMALEASPPLVPDGEVVADMSALAAQMTRSQPIRATECGCGTSPLVRNSGTCLTSEAKWGRCASAPMAISSLLERAMGASGSGRWRRAANASVSKGTAAW